LQEVVLGEVRLAVVVIALNSMFLPGLDRFVLLLKTNGVGGVDF
jgi:hypothetical protein